MRAPDKPTTKIKTAVELGLKDWYFKGLWEVLRRLEAGWFEHESNNILDMSVAWKGNDDCGSVGCIHGWALHFAGRSKHLGRTPVNLCGGRQITADSMAHARLITPPGWMEGPRRFTPQRCAKALRAYLETGDADWGR